MFFRQNFARKSIFLRSKFQKFRFRSIGMATVCLLATVGFAYTVLTLRNWSQFREPWSAGVIRGDFLAESIVSGRNSYDFYVFVNFKIL